MTAYVNLTDRPVCATLSIVEVRMTLVETYRGYDIYEVEKRGRKMWTAAKSSMFSLQSAKIHIDEFINSSLLKGKYGGLGISGSSLGYYGLKEVGASMVNINHKLSNIRLLDMSYSVGVL